MEQQFQERIARAREAARLASIAALSRGSSDAIRGPPPPLGFRSPPAPPPSLAPPPAVDLAASIPNGVRNRIDRLVEFIARNGPAFEVTAREREQTNPDFAFLHTNAPFHDYFDWKKAQAIARVPPPVMTPHLPLPAGPPVTEVVDPILHLPVGAMANACKAARSRGLPAYTPLPPDLLLPSPSIVPCVEPARLDARLAEFYRTLIS